MPPAPQQLPNPLPSHVYSNGKPHRPFGETRFELVGSGTDVVVGDRIIGSLVIISRVVDACKEFVLKLTEIELSLEVSDKVVEIPSAPGP